MKAFIINHELKLDQHFNVSFLGTFWEPFWPTLWIPFSRGYKQERCYKTCERCNTSMIRGILLWYVAYFILLWDVQYFYDMWHTSMRRAILLWYVAYFDDTWHTSIQRAEKNLKITQVVKDASSKNNLRPIVNLVCVLAQTVPKCSPPCLRLHSLTFSRKQELPRTFSDILSTYFRNSTWPRCPQALLCQGRSGATSRPLPLVRRQSSKAWCRGLPGADRAGTWLGLHFFLQASPMLGFSFKFLGRRGEGYGSDEGGLTGSCGKQLGESFIGRTISKHFPLNFRRPPPALSAEWGCWRGLAWTRESYFMQDTIDKTGWAASTPILTICAYGT